MSSFFVPVYLRELNHLLESKPEPRNDKLRQLCNLHLKQGRMLPGAIFSQKMFILSDVNVI